MNDSLSPRERAGVREGICVSGKVIPFVLQWAQAEKNNWE